MKPYDAEHVFNVALVSHGGAGKTSLTEAMLFRAGAITRLGSVDEGNATTDFDLDEVKRRMSVSLAIAPLEWKASKVNLLDTPGYADFFGEVIEGLHVADGAIVVVDGVSGSQVGTEQCWRACAEREIPRIVVVNKLDRENADYDTTVERLRERYGTCVAPLTIPVGRESSFRGTVELISRRAYLDDSKEACDVPAEVADAVEKHREALIESICELDDDLLSSYLDGEELEESSIRAVLAKAVREGQLVPVLAASSSRLFGIDCVPRRDRQLAPVGRGGRREAAGERRER
jgi:elongation factor G